MKVNSLVLSVNLENIKIDSGGQREKKVQCQISSHKEHSEINCYNQHNTIKFLATNNRK